MDVRRRDRFYCAHDCAFDHQSISFGNYYTIYLSQSIVAQELNTSYSSLGFLSLKKRNPPTYGRRIVVDND